MQFRKTPQYEVDPVCIFNIVSQYMKKPVEADKCFGLIWGTKDTHIESTCAVANNEEILMTKAIVVNGKYEQVYYSRTEKKPYHIDLQNQNKLLAPKENIVEIPKALIGESVSTKVSSSSDDENRIELDTDHLIIQKDIHARNHKNQQLLGWYCTGDKITKELLTIHSIIFEFFLKKSNPFLLLVNTDIQSSSSASAPLQLQLFRQVSPRLGSTTIGSYLQRVPIRYHTSEDTMNVIHSFSDPQNNEDTEIPELGCDIMKQYDVELPMRDDYEYSSQSNLEHFHQELVDFKSNLETLKEFVGAKLNEDRADSKDRIVGELIKDAMLQLPVFSAESFDPLYQTAQQDLLMVNYLAKLARAHSQVTDRLILSVK